MFVGSLELAILSGPLALQWAKRFWVVWLCDCRLRVNLFTAPRRFCSGVHRAKVLLNLSSGVWISAYPRIFPKPAGVDDGRMTGGRSHEPVTVVIAQGIPVGLAGIGLICQYSPVLLGRAALSTGVASMIAASARDPRSDGKPRPEDHQRLRKRRRVVASGTDAKRSGPQHSMKSSHS
ncbi:MAG: hypothetical protein GDA36_04455 [Rhodobacteraceae bacterium]|nr:hypothetical protein [Paracoccaceae bacterium]